MAQCCHMHQFAPVFLLLYENAWFKKTLKNWKSFLTAVRQCFPHIVVSVFGWGDGANLICVSFVCLCSHNLQTTMFRSLLISKQERKLNYFGILFRNYKIISWMIRYGTDIYSNRKITFTTMLTANNNHYCLSGSFSFYFSNTYTYTNITTHFIQRLWLRGPLIFWSRACTQ